MRVFTIFTALAAFFLILTSIGVPQDQREALQEKIQLGQRLYQSYGCADCHKILGKGGKGGPDLGRVTLWASPLLGAAVMWNHVKIMELAMKDRFLQWPEFKRGDITLIFTYLHSLNPQRGGIHLYPGEAPLGRETFSEVGCQTCHGEPFGGGHIGSDLGKIAWASKNKEEFATRMLRHAPPMVAMAQKVGLAWPNLTGHQMANIFAYLQTLDYANPLFHEGGDKTSRRGAKRSGGNETARSVINNAGK